MPKNDSQFNKIKNVPAWGLIAMYGIMNKLSTDIKAGNKIFNAPGYFTKHKPINAKHAQKRRENYIVIGFL